MIDVSNVIDNVSVVDDSPDARQSWQWAIQDADLAPIVEDGPLGDLAEFINRTPSRTGALCDFELRARNYASFTGAQLVAGWYEKGVPSVLCTRYERTQIDVIRPLRRWIPSLMTPDDLNPESLVEGLRESIFEIGGEFRPRRRPWRTQVKVVDFDRETTDPTLMVEIPGWQLDEVLRVRLATVPTLMQRKFSPGFRTHAMVNVGAETAEDLFICEWELN